ncbi:MAG: hypothetical protein BWY82_01744 [Verrucomicrobia bacterium ADurb.Bin474]|nr:MAG: hypothetical protein BWY82_01744 [Verrucomicrobia bacterium ADurb.Bin474]
MDIWSEFPNWRGHQVAKKSSTVKADDGGTETITHGGRDSHPAPGGRFRTDIPVEKLPFSNTPSVVVSTICPICFVPKAAGYNQGHVYIILWIQFARIKHLHILHEVADRPSSTQRTSISMGVAYPMVLDRKRRDIGHYGPHQKTHWVPFGIRSTHLKSERLTDRNRPISNRIQFRRRIIASLGTDASHKEQQTHEGRDHSSQHVSQTKDPT